MSAWADLARTHAPMLVVAGPLLGAASAFVWPGRAAWAIGLAGCVAAAFAAIDQSMRLLGGGAPASAMGGALVYDGVSIVLAPLLTVSAALVLAAWRKPLDRAAGYALSLVLLLAAGWLAALLAADLVSIFLAVETAWLAAVGLTALSAPGRGALNAGLRMLMMGGAAAAMFVVGAGLILRGAGGANVSAIAETEIAAPALAAAGVLLVLFALALKAGVAPLHGWTGPTFARAGSFAAASLGAINCVGALALAVRVLAEALAAPAIAEGLSIALAALGGASMLIGSAQAVGAADLRRLSAYALAAMAGGVLVSAALGSPAGNAAALVQLFALAAAALGLLCGAAAAGVSGVHELDGLARRAPLASAAITASALSLMSAPLTIGFLGRWRLVEAAIGAGWWWVAAVMVAASLAGVFYGGRLIERMYFRRAADSTTGGAAIGAGLGYAPALLAAICATAFGLAPGALLQAAAATAALLTEAPS